MKITKNIDGEALRISLEGNLDEITSPAAEIEINNSLDNGIRKVIFDLSGVNYISSIGIRLLIVVHKDAIKHGRSALIEKMSPKAKEILEVVGILPLFEEKESQPHA